MLNPGEIDEHASGNPADNPGEDELTALRREVEDLRNRNLRLIAEQRNITQRAQRDREESVRYAIADFTRDLLVILDDLERSRQAAASADSAASVAEGVRIVHENFLKLLAQNGVQPIAAAGKPFDPAEHEALMQQPHDEVPAGCVVQEVQRGYRMHQRVLRPTRVIVSTGPGTA